MAGIGKRFGPSTVLQGVDLAIFSGEVHILAGENGAGKSTLIKILAGIHTEFDGKIELDGREIRPKTPLEAQAFGIAVIHQELSLIGPMSVADNLFLGRAPARAGWMRDGEQRAMAREALRRLGLEIDVDQPVEHFSIATQQLIEIAKAMSQNARVIVMDEPTSALNAPEVGRLFDLIQSLKQNGCGIVYISHKMEEIQRIADRITVLRDGRWIHCAPASEVPPAKLIELMVGRDLGEQFPRRASRFGAPRLNLENFSVYPSGFSGKPTVQNVSLTVRAGEILGIGGLQGCGASDLFGGLFGAFGSRTRGDVSLDSKPARFSSPRQAIDAGVVLVTNDRKATGLVLSESIISNLTLAALHKISPGGWRNSRAELDAARRAREITHLRAASLDLEVRALSGGNQQKVAIAKWLELKPRLLLLDEPTRGIDIGAKREIYQLMEEWTENGAAVIMISSEMPELLALSDRIAVLHRGSLTAEFTRENANPARVLEAAMGKISVNN
jgi:ABC-type sugar transport system ATPase subunit